MTKFYGGTTVTDVECSWHRIYGPCEGIELHLRARQIGKYILSISGMYELMGSFVTKAVVDDFGNLRRVE